MDSTHGLSISIKDFESLPIKKQLIVLYENTEKIKDLTMSYKFHQKIQWAAITLLAVALGLKTWLGVF